MPRLISLYDVRPILTQLAGGNLFITPNQRLASRISASYAIFQSETDKLQVIKPPNVHSLHGWIERCWGDLLISAYPDALKNRVLGPINEQAVWETVISESPLGQVLLRPSATAAQAAAAYRTLIEWDQDLGSEALLSFFQNDEDGAALLTWINRFEAICSENSWLSHVRRTEIVIDAFIAGHLSRMESIYGIAFESIPPLYKRLISVAGNFQSVDYPRLNAQVNVVRCQSDDSELNVAAVWAKQVLRSDKEARVALVIPDLAQRRNQVQRVLQEVFETGFNEVPNRTINHSSASSASSASSNSSNNGNNGTRKNLPFNLSAGYPLLEAPVIVAALNVLSLQLPNQETETLEAIAQSPFYGLDKPTDTPQDIKCRSKLISLLYAEQVKSTTTSRFRQLAEKVNDGHSENSNPWYFSSLLQDQANLARRLSISNPRSPAEWVICFQSLLTSFGWPGNRELDSIEFQQVSQWQSILTEFSNLELILVCSSELLSYGQAIAHMQTILSKRIFQPQTVDSPLQVLGTLEAAGLQFSHLWVTSMSEREWPPSPSPNPLIPTALQRSALMPHASPERELEFAKSITERLVNSAKDVVVSFAQTRDENPESISALFAKFPQKSVQDILGKPLEQLVPKVELRRRHFESSSMETIQLKNAPRLAAGEKVKGGSSLFSSQSACPFRAFANHRLGIKALKKPEIGLNAADRGSLLHRALEFIWEKLKDQAGLLSLDDEKLENICFESATYAVTELAQKTYSQRLGSRFQKLEALRLKGLLLAWLSIEKERSDFTVEALEQRKLFRFQQLELDTRIDRIDRLADKSLLVIDYKTGITNINRWWGDRPDEPQLPLYSMLTEAGKGSEVVGGIAFAKVRVDGCTLTGIGDADLPEDKIKWSGKAQTDAGSIDWQHLKQDWVKVLTALAEDFIEGKATIDPKTPAKTCQYCDLAPVCRINHKELTA